MRRNLVRFVTAMLVLCICVLWVRSYWWSDMVGVNSSPPGAAANLSGALIAGTPTGTFIGLSSYAGSLYIVRFAAWSTREFPTGWSHARIQQSFDDSVYANSGAQVHFAGFGFEWHGIDSTIGFVGVPFWLGLVACALPVISRRRRARRWRRQRLCAHCGYDIQTTPDRCPECGKVSEKA